MRHGLRTAFINTSYRVFSGADELLLRVDVRNDALARLLHEMNAPSAAILTAFNPQGRWHGPYRNRRSQQCLRSHLERSGYRVLEGSNQDPLAKWPDEPSLLVPALPLAGARRLARQHDQAAFLWIGSDAVPRLVETAATACLRR